MSATLDWQGDQAVEALTLAAAQGLVDAAQYLAEKHRAAVGQSAPPASRPGQYPRRRTGRLQRSVKVSPASASEARRTKRVAITYDQGVAPHAQLLADRKGIEDTVERHRGELLAIIARGGSQA